MNSSVLSFIRNLSTMAFSVKNAYYGKVCFSYLKHRKLAWRFNSRPLCSKSDSGADSGPNKENSDSMNSLDKKVEIPSKQKTNTEKRLRAKENLVALLSELKVDNGLSEKREHSNLNLAKPLPHINKKKVENEIKKIAKDLKLDEKLILAVKDIATNSADHSEEIETELISGIISVQQPTEDDDIYITRGQRTTEITDEISENMRHAVEAVASTVVVEDSKQEIKSDLTKRLIALAFEKEASSKSTSTENMSNLFEGLKIERGEQSSERTSPQMPHGSQQERENQFHRARSTRPKPELQKVDLFASPPLGVFNTAEKDEPPFSKDQSSTDQMDLLLWNKLAKKELKSLIQFAPTNAFEEMIQLTEQGKHWTFPIDNEFDMGDEETVGFHEHVFLDHWLEGFPETGPIRHFMELVVTGLSKNPYITVERKKENIDWFRQYFEEKKDILQHYQS